MGVLEAIRVEVGLAVAVPESTTRVVAVGTGWVMLGVEVKSIANIVGEGVSPAACNVIDAVGVVVKVGGKPGMLGRVGVKPDGVGVNKKTPVTINSVPGILPSSRWITSNASGSMGAFFSYDQLP